MLERSVACFVLGLLGLLPLVGFPLALFALLTFRRVILESAGQWNAAWPYLVWGLVLGAVGVLLWLGTFLLVLLVVVHNL